jgi:hypothetical protein
MKLIENQYMNGKNFDGAWNFGPKYEDCINVADDTSNSKYSRARARARRERQLRDRRRALN